jgi:hypothetical protein
MTELVSQDKDCQDNDEKHKVKQSFLPRLGECAHRSREGL